MSKELGIGMWTFLCVNVDFCGCVCVCVSLVDFLCGELRELERERQQAPKKTVEKGNRSQTIYLFGLAKKEIFTSSAQSPIVYLYFSVPSQSNVYT
jgi:hypothetical protein